MVGALYLRYLFVPLTSICHQLKTECCKIYAFKWLMLHTMSRYRFSKGYINNYKPVKLLLVFMRVWISLFCTRKSFCFWGQLSEIFCLKRTFPEKSFPCDSEHTNVNLQLVQPNECGYKLSRLCVILGKGTWRWNPIHPVVAQATCPGSNSLDIKAINTVNWCQAVDIREELKSGIIAFISAPNLGAGTSLFQFIILILYLVAMYHRLN